MEYFVTGATGFLGSHLVDRLLDDDHEVVALVRDPSTATDLPGRVTIVEGDITDKASMREAMAGTDGVFHLAAWYRVGTYGAEVAHRINVEGTRNVLELMDELDVPKGVYTSTLAINSDTNGELVDETYRYDGRHLSVYDRTKWEAHHRVAEPMIEDGLPLVIVMPGVIYGPGDRGPTWMLWEAYLSGDLPVIPRETGYCWGHVEDMASAHMAAMDAGEPGETYIVAGEPYTLAEAFDIVEEIVGKSAPRAVSPRWFRLLARLVAPLERVLPVPVQYRAESLRVLGGVTYYGDNTKAERDLDLEHRPFEEGLRETFEVELSRSDGPD